MKIVFPKSPLMHDVCNQLINAWRMLRVALHTSSKYEFIVSHCHLVKSWGQYQTHILKRYESKLLFQKQVYLLGREQSSILSILEVADHSQNLQHAPAISHSQNRITDSFSANWKFWSTNLNFLSHPLHKLPCNENYLAPQVQIANSRTNSQNPWMLLVPGKCKRLRQIRFLISF